MCNITDTSKKNNSGFNAYTITLVSVLSLGLILAPIAGEASMRESQTKKYHKEVSSSQQTQPKASAYQAKIRTRKNNS